MARRMMALLHSVHKITETRGGAIYKTKWLADVWVKSDTPDEVVLKAFDGDLLRAKLPPKGTPAIKFITFDYLIEDFLIDDC